MSSHIDQLPKSTHIKHPKYRADIDGLRAIAVLSVVIFHAFPNYIRGGFVGVDIFFVISGYLISTIILGSLQANNFSFIEFYSRRIKRIFPSLLIVLISTFIFGWFALLAEEYKQLGKHIAGGAGFISNFMFWNESGYFDNVAETKPLLHLWSLGIEEQFYIFWPLLMWVSWKNKFNLQVIIVVLAIFSFGLNVVGINENIVATFYSPQTRFWELMLGSILAYMTLNNISIFPTIKYGNDNYSSKTIFNIKTRICDTKFHNFKSLVGGVLILTSFLFTNEHQFPGWWATIPTIGVLLIISAGSQSWLNEVVLSNRVLVWFGLISYPLYLWHWPILSFARIMVGEPPSIQVRFTVVIISIFIAWLTYKLIEKPIRFAVPGRYETVGLLICMIIIGLIGFKCYENEGLRKREAVQSTATKTDELNYFKHWDNWSKCVDEKKCRILDSSKEPEIALIGDSHAGHLASGLSEIYRIRNENIVIRLSEGCMPFFELNINGEKIFDCENERINKALEHAINSSSIKTIILTSYSLLMIQGNRGDFANELNSNQYNNSTLIKETNKNAKLFKTGMYYTLKRLVNSGKKIIYIVDIPELYFDPTLCISIRPLNFLEHELRKSCFIDRSKFEERNADYHRIINEAKKQFPNVKFINAYEYLCDSEYCYAYVDGKLLYQTRDHLTPTGSRYLIKKMANELLN